MPPALPATREPSLTVHDSLCNFSHYLIIVCFWLYMIHEIFGSSITQYKTLFHAVSGKNLWRVCSVPQIYTDWSQASSIACGECVHCNNNQRAWLVGCVKDLQAIHTAINCVNQLILLYRWLGPRGRCVYAVHLLVIDFILGKYSVPYQYK